jgi:hypothetical protein
MKQIPTIENSLAIRTDFSDPAAWDQVRAMIEQPVGEFRAYVDFVSDPEFDGLTPAQLLSSLPEGSQKPFAFLVDRVALKDPEHPILVVDLLDQPGRTFRVIPTEAWGVENNLSIGNMGFEEFAEATDEDGIFRGFPKG